MTSERQLTVSICLDPSCHKPELAISITLALFNL